MPKQPLAEVFGFPVDNSSDIAKDYRDSKLCPYNNKVPNCTKSKADDPLGVCSIHNSDHIAITCPVRFRERWLIAREAAAFIFPGGTKWTTLLEVQLKDGNRKSAGNIDVVLVAYDEHGRVTDFGSLEVQAVYISGNVRRPFEDYLENSTNYLSTSWRGKQPRADYLSSSRKRLLPQLSYKGAILSAWGRKQVVALHKDFYHQLPKLPEINREDAKMAWLLYDLKHNATENQYHLVSYKTVYTDFEPALQKISTPKIGKQETFIENLQEKLNKELDNAPDTRALFDDDLV